MAIGNLPDLPYSKEDVNHEMLKKMSSDDFFDNLQRDCFMKILHWQILDNGPQRLGDC